MKRHSVFLLILILTVLSVLLTGCVTLRNHVDDINVDEVSSIDIYDLRELSSRTSGFHEDIDPIYTLEETTHSEFLDDLAEIEFTDTLILLPITVDPSFYYDDWVVRINFSDDSYRFISCLGYWESFDANGKRTDSDHYGCDDEIWEQLIGSYVPEEIFS